MHRSTLIVASLISTAVAACETTEPDCLDGDTQADADPDADADTDTDTDADADTDADSDTDVDTALPNSPPTVLAARIQGPACEMSITDTMEIMCLVASSTTDPDGDRTWYNFAWSVDGEDIGLDTPNVGHELTEPGQEWTCTITPFDGIDEGEPVSTSVDILGCASLAFSGGSDGVVVDEVAGLPLGAELTVEAWVRWSGSSETQWHTIAGQGMGAEAESGGWLLAVASEASGDCSGLVTQPGQVVAQVQGGPCSVSTGTVNEHDWTHVAAVLDSGTWTLWIDGSEDYNVGSTLLVSASSTQPLRIGTMPAADSPWGFVGNIDEVRLMTTVHYAEPFSPSAHPLPETGTIGLWHMDDGEGDLIEDTTHEARHGDIEGATWSKASSCDTYGT